MKTSKIVGLVLIFLVVFTGMFSSMQSIGAGEIGIHTRFGSVVGEMTPGLHFITPFTDSVSIFDVQTQKEQVDAAAASSDLQDVHTTIAVNYNLDTTKVSDLYSRIGVNYQTKVIDPAIQETVKSVTANYTAEELITKRSQVTADVEKLLGDKLSPSDINVSTVNIVNFNFSDQFNQAVESKVTAEQNALAAKNKLDQVNFEAQQTVASAKAQAEAIQIQAQAIQQQGGANYVQLQAVNKWDGHLPTQMIPGATLPFINLTK